MLAAVNYYTNCRRNRKGQTTLGLQKCVGFCVVLIGEWENLNFTRLMEYLMIVVTLDRPLENIFEMLKSLAYFWQILWKKKVAKARLEHFIVRVRNVKGSYGWVVMSLGKIRGGRFRS